MLMSDIAQRGKYKKRNWKEFPPASPRVLNVRTPHEGLLSIARRLLKPGGSYRSAGTGFPVL